jgi:aspartate racemase
MLSEKTTPDISPPMLGLIAGLGVGAGIFYYRSLVDAHRVQGLSPSLVMVHADVQKVMSLANARESHQLAEYLLGLLSHLANGGAKVATIPAFSPQISAQELAARTPLPLISLLDAIVDEVSRRRLGRVAVFGARVTMETGLFGRLRQVADVVSLRANEIDQISGIYGEIVKNEKASPVERETLQSMAHTLISRENLDAIVLAGTDLSLVFDPDNAGFPHVDGARTHIAAIMHRLTCP